MNELRKKWIVSLAIVFIIVIQGCAPKLPIETNVKEKVADFSFINQNEQPIGLDDLKGNWWIADFIFTNCTTACLPMSANMSMLQERISEEGLAVQLISFSVDPDFDSPEVLQEYGEQYGADFSRWNFLTGYDFNTIKQLSVKSFRAFLQAPDDGSDQFTHDTRFFLVDPDGNIVKGYNGLESVSVEEIMDDLLTLHDANLLNKQ